MKFIFKYSEPGKRTGFQMFRTKIAYEFYEVRNLEARKEEHINTIIKSFLYQRIYDPKEFSINHPYHFDGFIAKYGRLPNDNDIVEIIYSGSPHKTPEVINVDSFEMVYYSVLNWRLVK